MLPEHGKWGTRDQRRGKTEKKKTKTVPDLVLLCEGKFRVPGLQYPGIVRNPPLSRQSPHARTQIDGYHINRGGETGQDKKTTIEASQDGQGKITDKLDRLESRLGR